MKITDLQMEVKILKREVAINKQLSTLKIAFSNFQNQSTNLMPPVEGESSGIQANDVEKVNYICKVYNKKWLSKITIKVRDFKLETIARINFEADQNVIQEGLIPSRYFEKNYRSAERSQ